VVNATPQLLHPRETALASILQEAGCVRVYGCRKSAPTPKKV